MKKLLSLMFLLSSLTALGQNTGTAELNLNYIPVKNKDTSTHVRLIEFKFDMPVYKTDNSRLSANFTYTGESFSDFPAAYGTDVYGLAVGLNWVKILNKRNVLTIFGQGGFYSDMHSLSDNAIRGLVGASYLTRYSSNFSLGFGAAYARQFYGNQIIPVVMVQYHFDDAHWKLGGLFPINPKLTYVLNSKSGISLEFKQVYSSYRLTEPDNDNDFVKNTKLTSTINYEYSFTKLWRISAGVGYAFNQKYELYRDGDNSQWYFIDTPIGGSKPVPIESIIHNSALFHIGIAFNPPF